MAVHGACDDGAMIVPGDLNHRRWVLAARNGEPVPVDEEQAVLDFGERLFVEGRDGCQRFSGFALLAGNEIRLDGLDFDLSGCTVDGSGGGIFAGRPVWHIELAGEGLVLLGDDNRLVFERNDWRK